MRGKVWHEMLSEKGREYALIVGEVVGLKKRTWQQGWLIRVSWFWELNSIIVMMELNRNPDALLFAGVWCFSRAAMAVAKRAEIAGVATCGGREWEVGVKTGLASGF